MVLSPFENPKNPGTTKFSIIVHIQLTQWWYDPFSRIKRESTESDGDVSPVGSCSSKQSNLTHACAAPFSGPNPSESSGPQPNPRFTQRQQSEEETKQPIDSR